MLLNVQILQNQQWVGKITALTAATRLTSNVLNVANTGDTCIFTSIVPTVGMTCRRYPLFLNNPLIQLK